MRLRVRSPQGVTQIGDLTPHSNLGHLKRSIADALAVGSGSLLIKAGFPPIRIAQADDTPLSGCGIRDGDIIVVEFCAEATPPPTVANAPSPRPGAGMATVSPPSQTLPTSRGDASKTASASGMPLDDGVLVVREMADDNSCLFHAIGYLLNNDAGSLRDVVAKQVLADPINFNEAILGKEPSAYASWIKSRQSWGGAIELAIFSKFFKVEICSVDISSLRVDRFGDGEGFGSAAIIFYSGIHYDAVALSPSAGAPKEFDQTTFEKAQVDKALKAAVRLAEIWKKEHKFTDLANFTLKCGVCMTGLKGQKEAQAHAMETGHTSFTEYS
ncbi:ubiquitin-specific protease otu1 [Irineochytrium annulatum]|nr:ubiquitin-specific protease otu1 [Irineochytrium annulatum]